MDTKPSGPKERRRLSSVATAIELLKAFSEDEVEIGISTLAKRLGVAKSTTHRLAATLVSEGVLEQDRATGKYRLGIALFRLGTLVRRRMNVSEEGRPHLFSLRQKTNETVHLAILDGTDIMYVYFLESTQAIRMRSDLGLRKPAYCTAEGQAILAFLSPEVVQAVIAKGLHPRTSQTITDPDKLLRALDAVRRKGCAIEAEAAAEFAAENQKETARQAAGGIQTIKLDGAAAETYRAKAYQAGWEGIIRQSPETGPKLREFFSKAK